MAQLAAALSPAWPPGIGSASECAREAKTVSGYLMLFVLLSILILSIAGLIFSITERAALGVVLSIVILIADLILFGGLFALSPNIAIIAQLFGHYVGTAKKTGLFWMNPFCTRKAVSLRIRNFETPKLKVNDREGNPIEIASVVVSKIVEGAVSMVEMALAQLSTKKIVELDEERKAAMVSNLLVVLCSDRHTQPVVNAGTLYQ